MCSDWTGSGMKSRVERVCTTMSMGGKNGSFREGQIGGCKKVLLMLRRTIQFWRERRMIRVPLRASRAALHADSDIYIAGVLSYAKWNSCRKC